MNAMSERPSYQVRETLVLLFLALNCEVAAGAEQYKRATFFRSLFVTHQSLYHLLRTSSK